MCFDRPIPVDTESDSDLQVQTPQAAKKRRSSAFLSPTAPRNTATGRDLKERFGPRYRNHNVTHKLLGQECNLGQAFQICMQVLCGPNIPTELDRGHGLRVLALRSAAHYCLEPDELDEILQHEPAAELQRYLWSMSEAHRQIWRYTLHEEVRSHFHNNVFTTLRPTVEVQGTCKLWF